MNVSQYRAGVRLPSLRPALPLVSCVTLGKSPPISDLQFPYMQNKLSANSGFVMNPPLGA